MSILVEHCKRQDSDRSPEDPGELLLICERQALSYDAVAQVRYRYEHGETVSLDFNTADRLLAGMGMWDQWYDKLSEYYEAVDLSWEQCACPGCSVMIHRVTAPVVCRSCNEYMEKNAGRGLCEPCWCTAKRNGTLESFPLLEGRRGPVAKYCSRTCSDVATRIERGEARRRIKHDLSKKCRNGHTRTPENTLCVSDGRGGVKPRCRQCQSDANARAYAKRVQVAVAA